jgi:hypothetical protein
LVLTLSYTVVHSELAWSSNRTQLEKIITYHSHQLLEQTSHQTNEMAN